MTIHDTDDFFGPVKTPEQMAKEIFAAREPAQTLEKPDVWASVVEVAPAEAAIEAPARSVLVEEHSTEMPEDPAPGWFPEDEPVVDFTDEAVDEEPEAVVPPVEALPLDFIDEAPPLANELLQPESQLPVDAVYSLGVADDFEPPPPPPAPAPPPVRDEPASLFNGYEIVPEVAELYSTDEVGGSASSSPEPLVPEAPLVPDVAEYTMATEVIKEPPSLFDGVHGIPETDDPVSVVDQMSAESELLVPQVEAPFVNPTVETSPPAEELHLPDPELVVDATFSLSVHDVVPPLPVNAVPQPDNEGVGLSRELLERLSVIQAVTPPEPLVIDGEVIAPHVASSNGAHVQVDDDEPFVEFDGMPTGEVPVLSELSEAATAFFQEPVGSFTEEPIGRHAKKLDSAPSPEETAREFIAQGGFFDDEPQRRLFGRRRNRD